jgi:hypothetical protein
MEKKQPETNPVINPIPRDYYTPTDPVKNCCCHGRPMWACPRFKTNRGNYFWLRDVEVRSLDMGKLAFA